MDKNKIVLASASPRRRELMSQVGIKFDVMPSNISEESLHGETAEEYVLRLSVEKASEVAVRITDKNVKWIIGSDTIVLSEGKILGKPIDDNDAIYMLNMLSGKKHSVVTGYCIYNVLTDEVIKRSVETVVTFKKLNSDEIFGYVDSGESMDKAGAYAIQGLGAFMVESIDGSYTNVVGLPICQIVNDLKLAGAVRLFSK